LREKNPEIKEQLDCGGGGEKQVAQCVWRDCPKDHFTLGERFLLRGNAKKNVARPVPLAGSEGGDMDFAEFVVSPRKLDDGQR
jgi:hypothetical protein